MSRRTKRFSSKSRKAPIDPRRTTIRWAGMSGAPILARDRVVGVVTRVVGNAYTAFAADALPLRALELAWLCHRLLAKHGRTAEATGLAECALRGDLADGLPRIVSAPSTDPDWAARLVELRGRLVELLPAELAIDRIVAAWVESGVMKQLEDAEEAAELATRLAALTGIATRSFLATALRLLAPLVTWPARGKADAPGAKFARLGLACLAFHDRRIVPGLNRIAVVQRHAQEGRAETVLKHSRAGPGTAGAGPFAEDLASEIDALGEADAEVARDLRELVPPSSPQPNIELVLILPPYRPQLRFHYRTRAVPFVGRSREIAAADDFLYAEPRFLWWVVSGPSRSGKSRLALELCLRHRAAWRAGFLTSAGLAFDWAVWQPNQPTLLVADNAGAEARELHDLLRLLSARSNLHFPVRLLMLERFADVGELSGRSTFRSRSGVDAAKNPELLGVSFKQSTWYNGLLGRGVDRAWIERARWKPPHHLETDDELETAKLVSLGETASDLDNLARNLLEQEEQRWVSFNLTEVERNALALATILDGLALTEFASPQANGILPTPE
jgi:hypothetical protein